MKLGVPPQGSNHSLAMATLQQCS